MKYIIGKQKKNINKTEIKICLKKLNNTEFGVCCEERERVELK